MCGAFDGDLPGHGYTAVALDTPPFGREPFCKVHAAERRGWAGWTVVSAAHGCARVSRMRGLIGGFEGVMLDYFSRLAVAVSQDEVWRLHCLRMADFGFDRLVYGHTRLRGPDGFGHPQDSFFLSNLEPALTRRYVDDGLFRHDPVLGWAAENVGARSWRDALNDAAMSGEKLKQNRSLHSLMNVGAGYSIAFATTSPHAVGYMHLAARADLDQNATEAIWARDGRQIETMNHMFNLKLLTLPRTDHLAQLTLRQREALEWVGNGKSYREIAAIMGVTPATVEKHLRLARTKLGVETTAQAILKAAAQNQIFSG